MILYFLRYRLFYFIFVFRKNFTEDKSGDWSCNKQLYWKRHNKVFTIGSQVIGNKLSSKSVPVVHAQNTCQSHLRHYRKNLNGKNNCNGSVIRTNDPEREVFRNMS